MSTQTPLLQWLFEKSIKNIQHLGSLPQAWTDPEPPPPPALPMNCVQKIQKHTLVCKRLADEVNKGT